MANAALVMETYLDYWDGLGPIPQRKELLTQYVEWPQVPANVQKHTIRWFEKAIELHRSRIAVETPERVPIIEYVIWCMEGLLQMYRQRLDVPYTIDELHHEYDSQSKLLNEEILRRNDSWPDTIH